MKTLYLLSLVWFLKLRNKKYLYFCNSYQPNLYLSSGVVYTCDKERQPHFYKRTMKKAVKRLFHNYILHYDRDYLTNM